MGNGPVFNQMVEAAVGKPFTEHRRGRVDPEAWLVWFSGADGIGAKRTPRRVVTVVTPRESATR